MFYPEVEGCSSAELAFRIFSLKLNLTIALGTSPPALEYPTKPGLHICINCNESDCQAMKHFNPKVLLEYQSDFKFVTCYFQRNLASPHWSLFIRPFDPWIWIGLLCVAIVLRTFKRSPSNSFDILSLLFCQAAQNKGTFLTGFLSLGIMLFTYAYLGMITTGLIKALPEKQIIDVRTAVELGFR